MDKILENLKDPSWWFTAVFIAIVANILAAFFRSGLSVALSTMSKRYRVWREKKKVDEEREIAVIASDATLLVAECIRSAVMTMLSLYTAILFIGGFVAYKFVPPANSSLRTLLLTLFMCAGVATIYVSRIVMVYTRSSMAALKRHRERVEKQLNKGIKTDNQ